ncbi:unnamed protein product, partial [Amoebophrya sp. A25]
YYQKFTCFEEFICTVFYDNQEDLRPATTTGVATSKNSDSVEAKLKRWDKLFAPGSIIGNGPLLNNNTSADGKNNTRRTS